MTGFMEGKDWRDRLLLPDSLDDYVSGDNQVRVVGVFVDELDLRTFGFAGPAATGRPGYSPATMLKLYLCLPIMPSEHNTDGDRLAK
jgi:transposase